MLITLELCRFAWFPSQAALKNNTIQHKLKADDSCEANKIGQLKLIFSSGLEQTWNEIEREIMRCSIILKIHSALQKSHSTPVTSSDSNGFGAHCVTFCLLFCSVNSSVLIKCTSNSARSFIQTGKVPVDLWPNWRSRRRFPSLQPHLILRRKTCEPQPTLHTVWRYLDTSI